MAKLEQRLAKQLPDSVVAWTNDTGYYIGRIELPAAGNGDRRRREFRSKDWGAFLTKARALHRQFKEAGDLATASPTVAAWLTTWLNDIASKRVRPKTLSGYRSVISRQIIPAIGNVRLEKLSAAHMRMLHNHITGAGLSSTYALNAHRVFAKALEDAIREGKIGRNPAHLVDAPRKARADLESLDLSEAKAIIKLAFMALDQPIYDPHPVRWATYLLTGQRRGEVVGLEWDRVGDLIDMSWQMQRLSADELSDAPADFETRHVEGGLYWTRPKSIAGWRMIPVAGALRVLLDGHRQRSEPNEWGLVFTHNGRPIDPDYETRRWHEALKAMGVTKKHIRVHDLRHTAVDLMLEAGIPEDVVKELVGHSDVAMTRAYKDPSKIERRTQGALALSNHVMPDVVVLPRG